MVADQPGRTVRTFRHALLWPLRLVRSVEERRFARHWTHLAEPWARVIDEFHDPTRFQERHYREFAAFLPYVQRLLYGEGGAAGSETSISAFRRRDVARLRIALDERDPIELEVVHVDLYFFYDIDIAILNVEIAAADLPFDLAQDVLFQFGRAFPAGWEENGRALHCPRLVEWLGRDGAVLASSDYDDRDRYHATALRERLPAIAMHWEFLLRPMLSASSGEAGALRYRLIEDFRIPMTAFIAVDEPAQITRADYVRLAFNTGAGDPQQLPFSERFLSDFEYRYCYDRFHDPSRVGWIETRLMCTDNAVLMTGCARDAGFTDPERGMLGRFRHEYFLICLIAHFHRATLLKLSDRLAVAVSRLDISDAESVRWFKREIRLLFETFLRFTHRYWFHEISNQMQAQELYRMLNGHLGVESLYAEVEKELEAMARYLDSDSLRRQANTILRLTVVTIFGLTGTVTTGVLGMNIFAMENLGWYEKTFWFLLCLGLTATLTGYTIIKSKRLSDFLDALSDERIGWKAKAGALFRVWWR
jgi:hypothetical protein